jgi:hypothetical protein
MAMNLKLIMLEYLTLRTSIQVIKNEVYQE